MTSDKYSSEASSTEQRRCLQNKHDDRHIAKFCLVVTMNCTVASGDWSFTPFKHSFIQFAGQRFSIQDDYPNDCRYYFPRRRRAILIERNTT